MTKLTTLADQVAEDATRLAAHLPQYLPAIRDAQAGQPGAQQYGMAYASGHVSDPTFVAAEQRYEGKDIAANDEQKVWDHLRNARRELDRALHILESYSPKSAIAINDRAGIGRCQDCNRYCDGKDFRLIFWRASVLLCDMCRKRRDRGSRLSTAVHDANAQVK